VTPTGVRDGDPDALAGLADIRGPAVLAYCEVVAGRGERAAAAAAEAFGSFRAGVVVAGDLATLNPEALLISATRHAAARHASTDAPPACARVPGLLAARADRSISLADHDWLEEHLASCWTCRAPVARFGVADKAYSDPPATPLPAAVKTAIVAAMTAAAPVRREIPEAPVMAGDGAHAAGPATPPSTNGGVPQAPAGHAPAEEPYTAYDLPALAGSVAVDQPTSAIPAAELEPPSGPSAGDRQARRRVRERRQARGMPAAATAAPEDRGAGGTRMPRPRRELSRVSARRRHNRVTLRPAVVLPIALVLIAIIAALAIAGVFGGGEPASAPQSYAPVVVVPGASAVSAAAVEKAKARARAENARKAAAAANRGNASVDTPAAATANPAPGAANTAAPPLPPPPPPPASSPKGNGKPKIDAGNGATGAEQLPPAKDTSNVPELAPPVEPVAPPPG
jgi:hypothetical protein